MGGKRWVESLIEQGTDGLPDSTKKRVRLTNIGALFGAIAMMATTPFDIAQVSGWMTAVDVVAVLVFLAILAANRRGHVTASRVGLVVLANLLVLTNATGLGRESGVELLFLALIALPFVVFDLRERGPLVLGLVMPLSAWVCPNGSCCIGSEGSRRVTPRARITSIRSSSPSASACLRSTRSAARTPASSVR